MRVIEQNNIDHQIKKDKSDFNETSLIIKQPDKKLGNICLVIGSNILIAYFITNFLSKNIIVLSSILTIEKSHAFYFFTGYILIIIGITFYRKRLVSNEKVDEKITTFLLNDSIKTIYNFFVVLPYLGVFSVIMMVIYDSESVIALYTYNFHIAFVYTLIITASLMYESFRLTKILVDILNEKVTDSKDRLSIILAILGALISLIALFR